jgi:hypothetical protein
VAAWLLAALVMPCAAIADVVPTPGPVPLPPTTQTAPATGTATGYVPILGGHSTSPDQNLVWYLFEGMIFVGPLLLTLVIEVPVIPIAGRGSKASWKVGVLVNTLTNPIAVAVVLLLAVPALKWGGQTALIVVVGAVEIAVVVAEWRVFRWALGWSNRRAIVTSLIANALSFGIGLLVLAGGIPL